MEKLTGYVTLSPAYGRDYKSAKAAVAAFYAGQDWVVRDPLVPATYANVDSFESGATAMLRYKNLTRVTPAKVP